MDASYDAVTDYSNIFSVEASGRELESLPLANLECVLTEEGPLPSRVLGIVLNGNARQLVSMSSQFSGGVEIVRLEINDNAWEEASNKGEFFGRDHGTTILIKKTRYEGSRASDPVSRPRELALSV